MGIGIDRELAGDIDHPSLEVISYAIKQRQRAVRRLDHLFAEYNGKQSILQRRLQHESRSGGHEAPRIMVNHAKYVTDMVVGFMTGNPISITGGKGKDIQPLMEVLDQMDINSHDAELEKDLSVFGEAYELIYLDLLDDGSTQERVAKIDPRGCCLVTDDTVDKTPLFGIHWLKKYTLTGATDGYLTTVYTPHNVITYRTGGLYPNETNIREYQETPQYFGGVQLNELRNNEERQGDYEQAVTLIDAYNSLQSDRLDDKDAFVDALLVVYGFKLEDSVVKNGMIEAPGKGDDGAEVDWLTKSMDESQIQLLAQSLEDDIHKVTYVPNMNDKNFMGNVSGEAMKYKLFGLLQLLAVKQRYLARGIQRRLKLLTTMINIKGQQADSDGAEIKIVPNIPVNLTDIVNNIKNADGVIPQQIALSWLPGSDNPDELVAMLNAEKQQNLAHQARSIAMAGGEQQSSYDNEDGGEPDDQGDNHTQPGQSSNHKLPD
ncbi:phage portal protein [Lacticaseibacillus yichunensis]|uniref:phage portal protein n=1 Tax=Lacticaseibacillus yichunensis TaxID=2486015 RepID=UPI000F7898C6|nr:phage portal protein [Lacticaseibacillus yichunensis]